MIVRLLIHNSECLGRALAGEALGLQRVYEEAIDQLDDTPEYLTPIPNDSLDETAPPLRHRDSSSSSSSAVSRRSSGSFLNVTLLSTRMVLSYYTALIRLLASCAPGDPPRGHAPPPSQLKRSTAERTLNILCNLVRAEEVVGILALPYSRDELNGLSPPHKEAALLFLDRVYGMASNDLLLRLLSDAFLPDLKLALRLNTEVGGHLVGGAAFLWTGQSSYGWGSHLVGGVAILWAWQAGCGWGSHLVGGATILWMGQVACGWERETGVNHPPPPPPPPHSRERGMG